MSFRYNVAASPTHPNVTAAMLMTQAGKITQCVFDLVGTDVSAREQRLQTLYKQMESFEIQPHQDEQVELIIRQSKAAIEEKLIEHTEAALQQAVYVQFIHDKRLQPQRVLGATAAYEYSLQDMVISLMRASRHLGMLEALKNLQGKHYSNRGAKGGARQKQATFWHNEISTYSRHGQGYAL